MRFRKNELKHISISSFDTCLGLRGIQKLDLKNQMTSAREKYKLMAESIMCHNLLCDRQCNKNIVLSFVFKTKYLKLVNETQELKRNYTGIYLRCHVLVFA